MVITRICCALDGVRTLWFMNTPAPEDLMNRIASDLTFQGAVEIFDAKNIAGLIPDGRTGTFGMKSKTRRDQIVSHARNAIRRAAGQDDVDGIVLTPYLEVLPAMARAHGDDRCSGRARNAESDVNTFLRVVEGRSYAQKRRVLDDCFLPDWKPLADALKKPPVQPESRDRFRRYRGFLHRLQDVTLLHGHKSPRLLGQYSEVTTWFEEAGIASKDMGNCLTAYRCARAILGDESLPPVATPLPGAVRGFWAVPNLAAFVERALARWHAEGRPLPESWAQTKSLEDRSQMEILELVAHQMWRGCTNYRQWGTTEARKSDDWLDTVDGTAIVFAAELLRLGEDPFALDYVDLLTESRDIVNSSAAASEGLKRAPTTGAIVQVPLLRIILDAAAALSWQHSELTLPPEQEKLAVPFYTTALFNNVSAFWTVVARVYGDGVGLKSDRHGWRDLERACEVIREQMAKHNSFREIGGHINKALLPLTWGHVVGAGIPTLWKKANAARTVYQLAWERHGGATDEAGARRCPAVSRARSRYLRILRRYIKLAVIIDDGMRIKNYARARLGKNVIVIGLRERDGRYLRIDDVQLTFRGYDRSAGPKVRRTTTGQERVRPLRSLAPGIVDYELLADYLWEARLDDLVRCGKLESREAYDPKHDEWALFVSPNSAKPDGGYTEPRLSKNFGRTIHWIARDLLHLNDTEGNPISSWQDITEKTPEGKTLRRKWRGLWNAHRSRQFVATFVGGVLGLWIDASNRTNDRIATLQDIYADYTAVAGDGTGRIGLHARDHFASLARRLIAGEVIDWATYDMLQPDDAQGLARAA